MKILSTALLSTSILFSSAPIDKSKSPTPSAPSIFGFRDSTAETAAESKFLAVPDPKLAEEHLRVLTKVPHMAGTIEDKATADYVAQKFRDAGLDTEIVEYKVWINYPLEISVDMTAPAGVAMHGPTPEHVDGDSYEDDPRIVIPFNGMSPSGDVEADVVYANYGTPEDFEKLDRMKVDVKGKVVLVRYSNPYSYRGFKALTAEREGVAALLIYSDPAEDGYKKGAVVPKGPWGPEYHIQRGAITYDFIAPGDPLTPGWASLPGAKRIPLEEARSVPKIMAMPLSWHDAKPLLSNMDGPIAPDDWQGGLPIKYHLGGNRVRVHVKIEMDNSTQPYYVVEGRIRGSQLPDEWIVLGNHRDAWVFGGVDPSSGTAAMMELTRALGKLAKSGMRPRRTLVVCSWDGEEVGLTGSTEWGEQFANELRNKAVAYINVDEATSGSNFHGQAVASLAPMLLEATRTLKDPSGKTLYEAWKTSTARERRETKQTEEVTDSNLADTRIGSGSDHTVFLNFVGMPVLGLGFEGPYGVYHSAYDDFFWMNHFGDPGYRYHTLMSQLWGVLALRLANADLLPFDFASYASNIRQFVSELTKGKDMSQLDLKPVLAAIDEFEAAGKRLDESTARALASGSIDPVLAKTVNHGEMEVERNWLNPDGIPGRPWFKHMLYGARFTYAHLELPGLTEAVEKQDWGTAKQQADILLHALESNTRLVNDLNSNLSVAAPAK
jgi:N-acetylated-alpha-linked acidic dipeptidase